MTLLSAWPVSPFVRARIRKARGLHPRAVLSCTPSGATWEGRPLSEDLLPSALGVAAAVAVTDRAALLPALASAAPVATTPTLAAEIGAVPGRDLLVSDDPDLAVQSILDDEHLAARLSRSGHALHTSRYAGTPPTSEDPCQRPRDLLAALRTPRDALIQDRVAAAMRPFTTAKPLEAPLLPEHLRAPATSGLDPTAVPPPLQVPQRTARAIVRAVLRRLRAAVAAFSNPDGYRR